MEGPHKDSMIVCVCVCEWVHVRKGVFICMFVELWEDQVPL